MVVSTFLGIFTTIKTLNERSRGGIIEVSGKLLCSKKRIDRSRQETSILYSMNVIAFVTLNTI